MFLTQLPEELIGRILCCLMDEPHSFLSLSSASRKFLHVAQKLVCTPDWKQLRPLTLSQSVDYQNSSGLKGVKCGVLEDNHLVCHYYRFYCLTNAKHRYFSTLRFDHDRMTDTCCIGALSGQRLISLVELELSDCEITLYWLNSILSRLHNLLYLELHAVSFIEPFFLVEEQRQASKNLTKLSITGDRTLRINDAVFRYFIDHFPATILDVSGSRVEYHRRIIQRFYPNANTADLYSLRPTELLFTFPMILLYLKRYAAHCKHFIADENDLTVNCLRRILQDEDLKNLKISCRNCPNLVSEERIRLSEQVDEADLLRVTF